MNKQINYFDYPTRKTLTYFGVFWILGISFWLITASNLFREHPFREENALLNSIWLLVTHSVLKIFLKYFKNNTSIFQRFTQPGKETVIRSIFTWCVFTLLPSWYLSDGFEQSMLQMKYLPFGVLWYMGSELVWEIVVNYFKISETVDGK